MASIRKASSISAGGNIVVLCYKAKPSFGISDEEFVYLKKQIEELKKKTIVFNRLSHQLLFVVADQKQDKYKRYETLRKGGNELAALLNGNKATSVLIVDETAEKENILSVSEGMALGSYQFIRHRKEKEKEKNSLHDILVYSSKVNEKDILELNAVIEATCAARDLVNEPVNVLNAEGQIGRAHV